jgi:hypothetical protein
MSVSDASPPTPSFVVIQQLWGQLHFAGERATRAEAALQDAMIRVGDLEWDGAMVELGMLTPAGYDAGVAFGYDSGLAAGAAAERARPAGFDAGFAAGVAAERVRMRRQVASRMTTWLEQRQLEHTARMQAEQQRRQQQLLDMVQQQQAQIDALKLELHQFRQQPRSQPSRARSRTRSPVGQ